MSRRQLRTLARDCGILETYRGADGARRVVTDRTCEALLDAMGLDASTEGAATEVLVRRREGAERRCRDPVEVVRDAMPWKLRARVQAWRGRSVEWLATLVRDDGTSTKVVCRDRVDRTGMLSIACPGLPIGRVEAHLQLECEGESRDATQAIFASPVACTSVAERLGQSRVYGLWAHIYALARTRDFGIGDLGHLARLVSGAAGEGAAFVAVQPLHALGNVGEETSPYSPSSRLFYNPIYLDLETIPEMRDSDATRDLIGKIESSGRLEALRVARYVDYQGVMEVKRAILEGLFGEFCTRHLKKGTSRGRAYTTFVEGEGRALQVYATFCALADQCGSAERPQTNWHEWPMRFREPDGAGVREFSDQRSADVEFHSWLQFEFARQLAAIGARAKAGQSLGLMGDLALGSGRDGADTWMHRELFAEGASLGAPPDAFAEGQNWDLPPLDPSRSRAEGHAYWHHVLRRAFEGMGAIRVDHVMGLFRQFWIPAGRPPAEGAYVSWPNRELLALLAIESHRAGAIVVGEDLGTRPAAFGARLARAGILSTRVLPFERTRTGFRAANRYGARSYVAANTHDLPPLRGWCEARDLVLRHQAGEFTEPAALAAAMQERSRALRALHRRLIRDGLEQPSGTAHGPDQGAAAHGPGPEFAPAVTAFLGSTPAPMLSLSVDDLVGERDPLNLPGIPTSRHPNWARRMRVDVRDIWKQPTARGMLDAVPSARRLQQPHSDAGRATELRRPT